MVQQTDALATLLEVVASSEEDSVPIVSVEMAVATLNNLCCVDGATAEFCHSGYT